MTNNIIHREADFLIRGLPDEGNQDMTITEMIVREARKSALRRENPGCVVSISTFRRDE